MKGRNDLKQPYYLEVILFTDIGGTSGEYRLPERHAWAIGKVVLLKESNAALGVEKRVEEFFNHLDEMPRAFRKIGRRAGIPLLDQSTVRALQKLPAGEFKALK